MQERPTPSSTDPQRRLRRRRWRIALLAVATTAMFALLFVQAAFNTLEWIRPSSVSETFSLYALSTINFLAFIVLLMVLVRNVIKLRREQLEHKLGARFKTRIVVFFLALSLLPVTFLFFMTTGLINRSIDKWFSLPGNEMLTNAWQIQNAYVEGEQKGLNRMATTIARMIARIAPEHVSGALTEEIETQDLIAVGLYDRDGNPLEERFTAEARALGAPFRETLAQTRQKALAGDPGNAQLNGERGASICLIASVGLPAQQGGALVIARQIPQNLVGSVSKIREFKSQYEALQEGRKQYRSTALQTLSLITLLVLFIAFWLAIYVARGLTDPVRQLAIATERIKSGDLSYRADVIGDDELAALARSFNEMTEEVADHRSRLEHSAEELQQINAALEERRRYIETILESLSAGVISLDAEANVTMINEAARQLLRVEQEPISGVALEALLPEEQREELRRMIARAAKLRSVAQEVHFTLANQTRLDAAVTITALPDPSGEARGAVIVIEDLTELIEAQRRAAWSEVARRMAHEIKNPLTPIRLSAERLAKNLLGEPNGSGPEKRLDCLSDRHERLVRECTTMISAEVATLQRMVDEFSNFARLPKANLVTASLNEVVEKTLRLYDERLEGIRLESHLDPRQPQVLIDTEQIKRVLVNLIDNAAEALAGVAGDRRILVSTHENAAQETVDLVVADTGPGIPPEHRNRVFDPYFSTRKRGTGLGLAIVSRIVAEHQGRIRLQAQPPRGARFVIELPGV
ncbi:MAG: ATP-binding protein [Blastocatellia bacterium]|nr:ATP-binding protein [Blastocatellia bacterium]